MYPDTYSQYDEQQAIGTYFDGRPDLRQNSATLRFLDIGAWDPKTFSNTRLLFENGWSGVLVEPSPGPMVSLLREYGDEPRVRLVQACVGLTMGDQVQLRVTDDSITAVQGSATHQLWKDQGGYYGSMLAIAIDWDRINLWFGGFHFVNIDAEGISVDLLDAMLKSGAKPECVCVEHDQRMGELCARATGEGYKLLYSNGTNAVFGR